MAENRAGSGRFPKGVSGNPGGRPAMDKAVKEMLRAATPGAVKLLVSVMENEGAPLKERLDAAKVILDRVYGKASQPIEGAVDSRVVIRLDGLGELAE